MEFQQVVRESSTYKDSKNMRYRSILRSAVFAVLVTALMGCGDSFFTRPPEDQLTADAFYNTEQDLQMATAALYNQVWFDWNDVTSFVIGDSRAGNMYSTDGGYTQFVEFSISSENQQLIGGWQSLYLAINHSNLVIQNIQEKASGDISDEAVNEALAEARFIRGYAYSYLGQLWGPVPIVTNTPRLIEQSDRRRNRREDVFQFAINDFEFAAEHLPPTQDEPGRVTEWSAKGMLSRMYWTRATFNGLNTQDLQQAQSYAQEVIENSGMSLREDFGDLFLLEEEDQNNQQEALFALQWTYEGNTWGTQNTTQAFLAASSELTGFADGWGGGTGMQGWFIEAFGANNGEQVFDRFGGESDDERRPETFMMNDDFYPELVQQDGGYTYEAGSDAYFGNATSVKKYVIGRPSDNDGRVAQQRTGIDTYMLRLAELYLTYVQAELALSGGGLNGSGSVSSEPALSYYNRVRERAGLSTQSSYDFMDIFMEKWKELAYEGQNWFQLVRWHQYEPEEAKQFIRDQKRGYSVSYNEDGEFTIEEPDNYSPLEVSDEVFSLPYPERDILQNELLLEDPVEYDFSEQGE